MEVDAQGMRETEKPAADPSFPVYLKASATAGVVAALFNLMWNALAPLFGGARIPEIINPSSITLASVLPALLAGIGFWTSVRLFREKGEVLFVFGGSMLAILSCLPLLKAQIKAQLPDGSPFPQGFVLLTAPMHILAGLVILTVIPRLVRRQRESIDA